MTLGKKLLELRANTKQSQVAFDLEISQSTYSDWENDITRPKHNNLVKLADYFKVDINELLDEVYNNHITSKKIATQLANNPNSKINSTEAIIKISESLEKLTVLVEKLVEKR